MGNVVVTAVKKNVDYNSFLQLKDEIMQFFASKGFEEAEIHISFAEE